MNDVDLVIFDCDGTLIDSETIANRVLRDSLAEEGLELTLQESAGLFMGHSWRHCLETIEARLGRPISPDFRTKHDRRASLAFRRELKPIPGVETALQSIPNRKCVASNSGIEWLDFTLSATGLKSYFDPHIFSAQHVAVGKPAPDLFLFAAAQMKATPDRCLVIEDSVPGVSAARAAGMRVLAYTPDGGHGPHRDQLTALGAVVFADMVHLPDLIAQK